MKTNKTKEQAWDVEPDLNWSPENIFYRGWERALASVVEEPGLTEEEIETILRSDDVLTANYARMFPAVIRLFSGRLPASKPTPQQEGGLTRGNTEQFEEHLEAAFWEFDSLHKAPSGPSERDAFKQILRGFFRGMDAELCARRMEVESDYKMIMALRAELAEKEAARFSAVKELFQVQSDRACLTADLAEAKKGVRGGVFRCPDCGTTIQGSGYGASHSATCQYLNHDFKDCQPVPTTPTPDRKASVLRLSGALMIPLMTEAWGGSSTEEMAKHVSDTALAIHDAVDLAFEVRK